MRSVPILNGGDVGEDGLNSAEHSGQEVDTRVADRQACPSTSSAVEQTLILKGAPTLDCRPNQTTGHAGSFKAHRMKRNGLTRTRRQVISAPGRITRLLHLGGRWHAADKQQLPGRSSNQRQTSGLQADMPALPLPDWDSDHA